jgi:hypothetical protein
MTGHFFLGQIKPGLCHVPEAKAEHSIVSLFRGTHTPGSTFFIPIEHSIPPHPMIDPSSASGFS